MTSEFVCPDCGRQFRADPDAGVVRCPNTRTCGGEIDVNEYRRTRKDDDVVKTHGGES